MPGHLQRGARGRRSVALLLALAAAGSSSSAQSPSIPMAPLLTPARTVGQWQQRVRYTIVATLDEAMGGVHATADVWYVNASPDTLRELWVHQHLNAFRPASRWSDTDEREGRTRFQRLADSATAYERFTAPVTINGVAIVHSYPIAPDSTVVRLAVPAPIRPGDSVQVHFAWDARLSTLPRRQARRGRNFDVAQWFPKFAVYDLGGWRANPLVPAGEFYGEFGDYDVTLIVADDQVLASTGVPVSGDPGWSAAARRVAADAAPVSLGADAYGPVPPGPRVTPPPGQRAVRFVARDVHHFGWVASPDFRYEGTTWVRPPDAPTMRFRTWPAVPIHVLYRPSTTLDCPPSLRVDSMAVRRQRACLANDADWRGGQAARDGKETLRWLESIYGPYGYPQLTIVRRADGGGTEFPMMMMNGSNSLDLVLHEGGHIYTYGMLANNEWTSGWLDEGFTSYQEVWHDGITRVQLAERLAAANDTNPRASADSALRALRRQLDMATFPQNRLAQTGQAQPLGYRADAYRTFNIYNAMVYSRGAMFFGVLHDVLGDAAFRRCLQDFYATQAFRHVDEAAFRASAERAGGRELGWLFDQWIRDVGTIDYALRGTEVRRVGAGWETRVRLERAGRYRHPMPVGVRTDAGWTVQRGDPMQDAMVLVIRTTAEPRAVALDPFGSTEAVNTAIYDRPLPPTRTR
jgi:hypothetical protein